MSYILLAPSEAEAVASGAASVIGLPARPGMKLMGYSITEDAGTPAAARLRLRHGTTVAGIEIADVKLAADQSTREMFGIGIFVPNGVFVERATGTTRLSLYWSKP